MKRRSSYKVTFLDRHGPAGMHRVKALSYAAVVFALSGVMFAFLFHFLVGARGFAFIGLTLVSAGTLSGASMYLGLAGGQAAGDVMKYVTAGGSSTPYEEQFSQEQALVMQRDYSGALACYEQRITLTPGEPRVRIAAADLYVQHGDDPRRAAELYREVQRLPATSSGQDVYVSNKLADLYLGPLDAPGRALVEFRRLIERYPGSTTAKFARMALDNVKRDLHAES